MALDIHKVRDLCRQASRDTENAKRATQSIMNNFRNLGSGFTGDRLYSREYSALDSAVKDAIRSLDRINSAINDISRKA